ncbi:MAG: peptidoglycan-binding domain-containing protein [Thiolinea sp.]
MLATPLPSVFRAIVLFSFLGTTFSGCASTANTENAKISKTAAPKATTATPDKQQALVSMPTQCRKEVFMPALFRETKKRLRVFEGSPKFTNVPASIEWTDTKFQTMPPRFPQETVPAVYRDVTEEVVVLRSRTEIIGKPATYKTITKPVTTHEAHNSWKAGCINPDPRQCLIHTPAKIQALKQEIIDIPARTVQVERPADKVVFQRKVLVSQGQGTGEPIPAEYKTVKVGRVSEVWRVLADHQPSRYEDIPVQVKVRPGSLRPTAVLCEDKTSRKDIIAIQRRLATQGYPVTVSGTLDAQTLRGVLKFQQDNQLAIGAITLETLRKLGFN